MEARKKCNAEMLRRCAALCTAKVRKDIAQNTAGFCPCIMRSQARRDLPKLILFVPLDPDTFNF